VNPNLVGRKPRFIFATVPEGDRPFPTFVKLDLEQRTGSPFPVV
jgi:hypothetical protein